MSQLGLAPVRAGGELKAARTGLAGHVVVEDYAILGGQTGVHQFVRVGAHVMTSGGSKIGQSVPPFTMVQGYPARLRGINIVGLRRRGFSDETIRLLRKAYRALFMTNAPLFEMMDRFTVEANDILQHPQKSW